MASLRLRRAPAGASAATIAAVTLGGFATGAALLYLFAPRRGEARRRHLGAAIREARTRAGTAAREARARAEAQARRLKEEAAAALRAGQEAVEQRVEQAAAHAEAGARQAQPSATTATTAAARRSPDAQAAQGAAIGVLLARAVFGRGLMRIPAGIAGVSLLSRLVGRSRSLRRGVEQTRDLTASAAERLRAKGAKGAEATGGAGRERPAPRAEVREVKSPAELEPGVARGVPEPTFEDRVDRGGPHMGGPAGGGYRAEVAEPGEDGGFLAPSTDDVERRGEFDAPDAGRAVREGELGMVVPQEDAEETRRAREEKEEREEPPLIVAPGEPEPNTRARIVAPGEVEAHPEARIVDAGERPLGSGASGAPGATRREPSDEGGG
ncbi:hypothetical protein [Anaeromyxobacter oryzisoli]|uniref:hypothetical protein n=1 Tax=Anaeromyxobacter oryzisoli TaxID=2925408 RepID=UPI001F577B53|nr:hypothetical protein [Anaeromyxobacter sp. SG63]